ncbi:MAG: acyltransferase [bacterium LCO1.1]|uniref:Acyltransferase n=1 Tax=Candidatus Weimeria bifida TaxID=2599074 RepID=A0A6N7IY83_9FIRM|nr:acyltransferase [Candidatus Weimeria bifida]
MRKIYLDNIRWCTIILVVFFHVFFFFNNIGVTAIFEGLSEYNQGDGMTLPEFISMQCSMVYDVAVRSGRCCSLSYLQHKAAKQFIAGRRNKLLVPSTLGVLVFGFIPGSIVAGASAGAKLQAAPGFVKYIVYTLSGIGAQWFSQMLFVISLLLLLVRKVVLAVQKEERKSIQKESSVYVLLVVMFFLLWGASKLLNTPVVESYRFGIYTVAFLLGYYVFSQDIVIEVLKKWRFVSTLTAVVSGVYFIYRAYGIYYGHSSLLSTWYANLFTYCMILAIFGMFAAYGDKKNAVTEWLGKISFPVYILHIPVILIALSLLQKSDLSVGAQYVIVAFAAYLLTPLAALLIEKIPVVRYLILGIRH